MSLRRRAAIAAAVLIAASCSKQPAPPATPLVQTQETTRADAHDDLSGNVTVLGIPSSYRATFTAGTLRQIDELRANSSDKRSGRYEFHGARLVKYEGAALQSTGDIELEFDVQGKVVAARAGSGAVSEEEIYAVRDRAELLRSHALAQRPAPGH